MPKLKLETTSNARVVPRVKVDRASRTIWPVLVRNFEASDAIDLLPRASSRSSVEDIEVEGRPKEDPESLRISRRSEPEICRQVAAELAFGGRIEPERACCRFKDRLNRDRPAR